MRMPSGVRVVRGIGVVHVPAHVAQPMAIHAWSMHGLDRFGTIFG